jgi:hypothetical protein
MAFVKGKFKRVILTTLKQPYDDWAKGKRKKRLQLISRFDALNREARRAVPKSKQTPSRTLVQKSSN